MIHNQIKNTTGITKYTKKGQAQDLIIMIIILIAGFAIALILYLMIHAFQPK